MPRIKKKISLRKQSRISIPNVRNWKNSGILIFGVILLIFFSVSFAKEAIKSYEIKKEVSELQSEINELDNTNQDLYRLVQYFNTDHYREKEARLRLNLQETGENVVVVPEEYLGNEYENSTTSDGDSSEVEFLSNPQRWWGYFFNREYVSS